MRILHFWCSSSWSFQSQSLHWNIWNPISGFEEAIGQFQDWHRSDAEETDDDDDDDDDDDEDADEGDGDGDDDDDGDGCDEMIKSCCNFLAAHACFHANLP